MGRAEAAELTCEQLIEALEKTRGFILAAQRYLAKTYDVKVSYKTIKKRVVDWGMEEWLTDMRILLAEDCMTKAFHKGCVDGDNHCIFWVLEKYGHHVDFLDGKDTETESKKGWRELLSHAKGITQPNTETKSA